MKKQLLTPLVGVLAIVLAITLAVGALGIGWVAAQGGNNTTTTLEPLPAGATYTASESELRLASVYNEVIRSVVTITTATRMGGGTGSGFVIDTDGHIVTNNHVVEGAAIIQVTFYDDTIVEAELVGTDPDADLAVIRVDPSAAELRPVTFADSRQVFIGQSVMAIGSPFGEQQAFTLTTGVVSGIDRSLQTQSRYSIPELIQTDAAINPGNSGGPLFDMAGNVIGVNTAILSRSGTGSGVGFAIPSNTVRRIVPYLIEFGRYEHSWLGISGMTLMPAQRSFMELPDSFRGVMVTLVSGQGPAAQAGLRGTNRAINTPLGTLPIGGDIITAINGEPIARMDQLISYLEDKTLPGDTITLTVWRNGQTFDVDVTLAARP